MESPKALASHRGARIALVALAVILAVMVLNTVIHYWNIRRLGATRDQILRSSEQLRAANQVYLALQEVETSLRAFLLTGQRDFLEPYRTTPQSLQRTVTDIQRQVGDHAEQAWLAALQPLLESKFQTIARALEIHDDQGPEAAKRYLSSDEARQPLEQLRTQLTDFAQEEREHHAALVELSDESTFNTVWFSIFAAVVGIGIVGLILYHVRRELLIREQFSQFLMNQDRLKSDFLAILGHEMRNPLAAIRNSVDVLDMQHESLPPAIEEIRAIIHRQTQVLVRLADDLMDTSRMAYSKLQLKLQPLKFNEVVERTVQDCRKSAADSDHTIEFSCPPQPCWVHGDEARLIQILHNLLHNACKFSKRGQTIRCELRQVDNKVAELTIQDHGLGISPDKLEEIFEPFRQSRQNDRSQGGLGLGLALVRGFVQLHGGTIRALSDGPNRGSKFVIQLPLIEAPTEQDSCEDACPSGHANCVVVIIDDRRDASYPMKRILEHMGHEVHIAIDGTQGIELSRNVQPDVVLCDIGLPGLSGMDVARELREYPETRDTYLVAITGYSAEEMREQSQLAGFDAFVTKPVSRDGLHKILSALPCHLQTT